MNSSTDRNQERNSDRNLSTSGAVDSIASRLCAVRKTIRGAASSAGRDPASVTLVAVSKTRNADEVRAAYEAGQRDFGENYVQELVAKAQQLKDLRQLRWHLIGHLQTNKIHQATEVASVFHALDSARIVAPLVKRMRCDELRVYIEVALAADQSSEKNKTGASIDSLAEIVAAVKAEPRLRLEGLMTVPPYFEDPSHAAPYYARLRTLAQSYDLPGLSMGMSHDFACAIAQGATVVRVGEAIFGPRAARSSATKDP